MDKPKGLTPELLGQVSVGDIDELIALLAGNAMTYARSGRGGFESTSAQNSVMSSHLVSAAILHSAGSLTAAVDRLFEQLLVANKQKS
jgi:hypothetical protein